MFRRKAGGGATAGRRRLASALAIDLALAAGWVATAGLVSTLLAWVGIPRVPMLFLAAVIFTSVGRGVRAGLMAAVGSFLAYDYFWVPPIHVVELRAYDLMALAIFLALALITALASGGLRDRERRSAARQRMLLAFARAGGMMSLPAEGPAAGQKLTQWVHEIVGAGVYYRDVDGSEARAGEAATWWDTVQTILQQLAERAAAEPGRTLRSSDFRARAVSDRGEVLGALVWLSSQAEPEARRESDDFVAVVADLAAAALGQARGLRSAA